jgi:hypothetical protein
MVYKILREDIMKLFENEESISIDIKKLDDSDFLVRLTANSGATKMFISDNWEDLFA